MGTGEGKGIPWGGGVGRPRTGFVTSQLCKREGSAPCSQVTPRLGESRGGGLPLERARGEPTSWAPQAQLFAPGRAGISPLPLGKAEHQMPNPFLSYQRNLQAKL